MPLPEVVYQSLCEATESLNTTRVSTSSSSSSSISNGTGSNSNSNNKIM